MPNGINVKMMFTQAKKLLKEYTLVKIQNPAILSIAPTRIPNIDVDAESIARRI
jgi:hypothetical protein